MRTHYVYILTNTSRTLYAGVTNDLARRVQEHCEGTAKGYTSRYKIDSLVYYEPYADVREAIAREKEIKGWRRSKKIGLIEADNAIWEDLADGLV